MLEKIQCHAVQPRAVDDAHRLLHIPVQSVMALREVGSTWHGFGKRVERQSPVQSVRKLSKEGLQQRNTLSNSKFQSMFAQRVNINFTEKGP